MQMNQMEYTPTIPEPEMVTAEIGGFEFSAWAIDYLDVLAIDDDEHEVKTKWLGEYRAVYFGEEQMPAVGGECLSLLH